MRERWESLLKCWVSRLLERAFRAKRTLAGRGGVVEKRRVLVMVVVVVVREIAVRSAEGRVVSDMVRPPACTCWG